MFLKGLDTPCQSLCQLYVNEFKLTGSKMLAYQTQLFASIDLYQT